MIKIAFQSFIVCNKRNVRVASAEDGKVYLHSSAWRDLELRDDLFPEPEMHDAMATVPNGIEQFKVIEANDFSRALGQVSGRYNWRDYLDEALFNDLILMVEMFDDLIENLRPAQTQPQKSIEVEIQRFNEGFWTDVTATLEREGTQRPMQLRFMQGTVHLDTGKHTITASQRTMVPYLRELRALLNALPEIDNPPPSHFREDECEKF